MSKLLQIIEIHPLFDKLQKRYGDKTLDPVYGAGQIKNPNICFVFMNPTGKNISANKSWKGLKAPWLGTKNTWKLLASLGIFDKKILDEILSKGSIEWDYDFAEKVYTEVKNNNFYITNLSKATQIDARALPNSDFHEYVEILKKEIDLIKPKIIITFGNQVSSILLGKNIKVSDERKRSQIITVSDRTYPVYPVYYPVGQGMRNINKSIEDIKWIIGEFLKK